MKHIRYSALVAIAAIAASCAKESTVIEKETGKDIPMEPMCIETGDESGTKTSLDGKTVNWTEGDQIAVYSNIGNYSTGYNFPAANIKGNTATFSGEVPAGTESFFAVYPPERVSSVSASGAVVTIPSDQTPAAGTFAEELNITIAKGTKTPGTSDVGTIQFRNVCSYVKFTVPAYVSDVNSVTISSVNAIAGNLTVDYTEDTPSSSIASDGAKSISMSGSFGAGKTFMFVIAPGTVSNFKIDITTAKGNWTRTIAKGFTATAGKPVNLGTVDFKQAALKASPSHTYEGGVLVGTKLDVNLKIDGFTSYVSDLQFDVKKGETTVRSYSSASVASSTVSLTHSAYADYPYLPQGDYTISGSYKRPDGSTQSISGSFTVPAPTFGVEALGMTSYSYYLAGNSTDANTCDAETIYGLGGSAKISDAILNNANYSSLKGSYSYTLDNAPTDAGDKTGQSWAAHTITATYTFDDVTVTSPELTCHITGLPCTLQPNNVDWKATKVSSYISFNSNNITITGGTTDAPTIQSISFYVPNDSINIESISNYYIKSYKLRRLIYYSILNYYIGENNIFSEKNTDTSNAINKENAIHYGKITSRNPYIQFSGETDGPSSARGNAYSRIYSTKLNYSDINN